MLLLEVSAGVVEERILKGGETLPSSSLVPSGVLRNLITHESPGTKEYFRCSEIAVDSLRL